MVNTVAYSTMLELIQVVGSFFTADIIFGISFLKLIAYTSILSLVIQICLGGISNFHLPSFGGNSSDGTVREVEKEGNAIETYKGGGSY